MNPEISVIIPIYQVENLLDRCVKSLLGQDFANFELILVDDGSTDACVEKCDAYAIWDARVRVIHKSNGGQSSARNAGLDVARGKYITFVDADDWVTTDYLSYLMSLFIGNGCKFTACNHTIVRDGRQSKAYDINSETRLLTRYQAYEETLFSGCVNVSPWGKLYERSVFDGLRFPEGRIFEDTWLFGDILNRTEITVFGKRSCYFYEVRQGSTVNQAFREQNLQYIEAAEKLAADAVKIDSRLAIGGIRRVNHARLSTLRLMEKCAPCYQALRCQLRHEILVEAPKYLRDVRTPHRDRVAVILLRFGFWTFYAGWRWYSKIRP